MKARSILFIFSLFAALAVQGQEPKSDTPLDDTKFIRALFDEALANGESYENLRVLCKEVGARLSGSPQAQMAVEWGEKVMNEIGLDKVYLQEIQVPHWVRGNEEQCTLSWTDEKGQPQQLKVPAAALGGSIATPAEGLKGELIEVQNFEELDKLGSEKIKGKIVYMSRPMDPRFINTFPSYGGCVNQRGSGAIEAAKYGAVGVIIRSMNLREDEHPHTGSMYYKDELEKIPSMAISTNDATMLSKLMKKTSVNAWIKMDCHFLPDTTSYNVIGELRGSEHPEKIIVVGGHLDSWDAGEGAHDDGAGCVQSMEVLRMFRDMGYRPKHTIRAVLFMNEENGQRGGRAYANMVKEKNEPHLAAIETDRGGFTPRGFSIDASDEVIERIQGWEPLLEPYDLHFFKKGGSGVDIGPLKKVDGSIVLIGLVPDSQRYFDYHHSDTDVFEAVNKRELEMGGGALGALIYLIDKYGF